MQTILKSSAPAFIPRTPPQEPAPRGPHGSVAHFLNVFPPAHTVPHATSAMFAGMDSPTQVRVIAGLRRHVARTGQTPLMISAGYCDALAQLWMWAAHTHTEPQFLHSLRVTAQADHDPDEALSTEKLFARLQWLQQSRYVLHRERAGSWKQTFAESSGLQRIASLATAMPPHALADRIIDAMPEDSVARLFTGFHVVALQRRYGLYTFFDANAHGPRSFNAATLRDHVALFLGNGLRTPCVPAIVDVYATPQVGRASVTTAEYIPSTDIDAASHYRNTSLLFQAVYDGDTSLTQRLLEAGAQPNGNMAAGRLNPLHLAASGGDAPLVRLLLQHGAYVDAQDSESATALHHAVAAGSGSTVQALLDAGANPRKQARLDDKVGPRASREAPDLTLRLQEAPAGLRLRTRLTPLQLAARLGQGELVQQLTVPHSGQMPHRISGHRNAPASVPIA